MLKGIKNKNAPNKNGRTAYKIYVFDEVRRRKLLFKLGISKKLVEVIQISKSEANLIFLSRPGTDAACAVGLFLIYFS